MIYADYVNFGIAFFTGTLIYAKILSLFCENALYIPELKGKTTQKNKRRKKQNGKQPRKTKI